MCVTLRDSKVKAAILYLRGGPFEKGAYKEDGAWNLAGEKASGGDTVSGLSSGCLC